MKSPARAVWVMTTWSETCNLALQQSDHSCFMFVIVLVCMYNFNLHVLFLICSNIFNLQVKFLVCSNIFNLHVWPFWATVAATFRCLKSIGWNKLLICQKEKPDSCGRGVNVKEKEDSIVHLWTLNEIRLHLLRTITIILRFFERPFRFRQSTTNQYQSILIYLLIGIDNRYQSITTRIFAIDWSSIININRLIDINWYRLVSIVIDYQIHRLDTPVNIHHFHRHWGE